ncbi:hypothetical protein [Stackebrandtia soli]|uniref:hypothetical protein n=1 Tax=Stackebrandtia soli TaxID=1892856 RepID=UPI0039EA93F8
MSDVTLRDLIRAARSVGAPLRRTGRSAGGVEYWQCWDSERAQRGALVRHWPSSGTWRVEMFHRTHSVDRAIRVDMQNPTVAEVVAAARMCGWEVPS